MHEISKINILLTHVETYFFTVNSLIRLNNIITGSHNKDLRTCNVKAAGFNQQYMDIFKIRPALYGLVDQFNNRRLTTKEFCDIFLDQIHPFLDGNGSTCKVLFEDKIENFYQIYKKEDTSFFE